MQYRRYSSGDSEAMFRLDELCFESPFRFTASAMRRFAAPPNALVILAEEDGALAGFVILHIQAHAGERVAYVVTLDVSEESRRSGVGSELMLLAEAAAFEKGCLGVLLHVFVDNQAAIHFYERLHFLMIERVEGFYGTDKFGKRLDAFRLRKALNPAA